MPRDTPDSRLALLSHELRTPLHAILGMADLLLAGRLPDEQRSLVSTIRASGDSILAIVQDTLEQARSATPRPPRVEPFSPVDLVESHARAMAQMAAQAGLEWTATVDPQLPPVVLGDGHRVRQILTNVVGNALKFTEAGWVHLRAERIGGTETSAGIRFLVADSGVGMTPEERSTAFEPFSQGAGGSARGALGTGLGLGITRSLVHQLGGTLELTSEQGVGTTVSVVLPFAATDHTFPSRRVSDDHFPGVTGVVVTGSPRVADAVGATLTALGVDAGAVRDADDAIACVEDLPPGSPIVMLVDLRTDPGHLHRLHAWSRAGRARGLQVVIATLGPRRMDPSGGAADVHVTLPAGRRELASVLGRTRNTRGDAERTRTGRSPGRILLVEDEPSNRRLLEILLGRAGHEVQSVASGREAVIAFESARPDLTLLDMGLPDMSGADVLRELRASQRGKTARIVILSGLSAGEIEEDLHGDRADAVVQKPVHPAALRTLVGSLLESREQEPPTPAAPAL
ncbi:MAG: ATP-binding protein [Longimicrobiales bacterium]